MLSSKLPLPTIPRRHLLAGATASCALALTRRADAATLVPAGSRSGAAPTKVRALDRDALGTTLTLALEHAPFPVGGASYDDPSVLAFVPRMFRPSRDGKVALVVHFHGHNSTAPRAIAAHQLREQLVDSRQDAILLVPQGPVLAPDSSCGKLEAPGGLAKMVGEALSTLTDPRVAAALGPAALPRAPRAGTVCLSAHSGGYHAAACSVKHGGLAVREVWLFDALYAEVEAFRDWVVAARGSRPQARHKLVSYFGSGATEANSQALHAMLQQAGVRCAYEHVEGALSREELTRAQGVFVRSALAHGAMTHELNELRDCLYASSLPRRLPSTWFEAASGARPLERREPRGTVD